jgi:hypothetical protein
VPRLDVPEVEQVGGNPQLKRPMEQGGDYAAAKRHMR